MLKRNGTKFDEAIKNAFIMADLRINLDSAVTETFENNEFLNFLRISILQPEINFI